MIHSEQFNDEDDLATSGELVASRRLANLGQEDEAGAAGEFWEQFTLLVGDVTGAVGVAVLARPAQRASGNTDADEVPWRMLRRDWRQGKMGNGGRRGWGAPAFDQAAAACAESAVQNGACGHLEVLPQGGDTAGRRSRDRIAESSYLVASPLDLQNSESSCVAVLYLPGIGEALAREALVKLNLAASAPRRLVLSSALKKARQDVQNFASACDLMAAVNDESRFLAASIAFCNGLASQLACDRVSLGWFERGFVRLRAISGTEKFNRKMEAAQSLEAAMDEALDQDEEVSWPASEHDGVVSRDHEQYAHEQRCGQLLSLPLRVENDPVAVVTLERRELAFGEGDVQRARLEVDLLSRRLSELKRHDRWFGARCTTALREKAAGLLGPDHTWMKIFALVVVAVLAAAIFVKVDYRAESKFALRSEKAAFVSNPFGGYIKEVAVRPGDNVDGGDTLLRLDSDDLMLQRIAAAAELTKSRRAAAKAEAENRAAEMRLARAQADQAEAKLKLVDYQLERSVVKAPFDGVVVEGDLREKIGSLIEQGDTLFKIARVDHLYVEAKLEERDLTGVVEGAPAEIAFVTRPKEKFPVVIERIEPLAVPEEGGNVFLVRCQITGDVAGWWRPGMSGVCKIDIGKRSLLWIATHRTIDFLRMKLWW